MASWCWPTTPPWSAPTCPATGPADEVAAARGTTGIAGIDAGIQRAAAADGISYVAAASRPRPVLCGTVTSIVDQMQDLFEAGGCDGFIVWATVSPTMFQEFGRLIVPELQRRGLVQTEYGPGTLREKLRR